jgi:autotransporter-associated beta strand protein
MAVGDHRLRDRANRVDVEATALATRSGGCRNKQVFGAHRFKICHIDGHGSARRPITNAGVDFSGTTGPGIPNQITAGSIAGAGTYKLGSDELHVGGNNLSTEVSGSIQDGGDFGGAGASLLKLGTGTLILSGTNTYTGGTRVDAGTLQIGNGGATGGVVGNITNNAALVFDRSDAVTYGGVISGTGSLTQAGSGALTLSGTSIYTGATTVNAGTLSVTGDISSSSGVTANAGGTLGGTGTVKNITINNGGTLAPGLPSAPGTLTATGSLVLQAAATYLVQVSPAAQSLTTITGTGGTGTATLNGATLAVHAAGGGYAFGTRYTVLTAANGINGTFANTTATSGPVTATVSYDANDVFITLSQAFITMPVSASGNAKGVANALNAYIADPPLPPAFQNLFNLSPAQLAEALAQLSGENNAGGGQQASFQMMNEFLLLMLNPFDADRGGGFSGAGFGAGSAVSQFAPDKERALPPEIARAYAAVTPPSEDTSRSQRAGTSGPPPSAAPTTPTAIPTEPAATTSMRAPAAWRPVWTISSPPTR